MRDAKQRTTRGDATGIARHILILLVLWTAGVSGLLGWVVSRERESTLERAQTQTRAHLSRDQAALHGNILGEAEASSPMKPSFDRQNERASSEMGVFGAIWLLGLGAICSAAWIVSRHIRQQVEVERRSLRDGEAKLRAITSSAQDAILMLDADGAITFWNPAAESILGYRAEEAIGQNLHRLLAPERFHPDHHAAFPEFVRTGHGDAIGKTVELSARRKDDEEISVALSLSAVQIDGAWHAVGILRDISDEKHAAEALQESMQRMELALQGADLGTWDWEVSTGKVTFNRRWTEMVGYGMDEIQPNVQTWKELVHPDDLPSVMEAVRLHLEGATEMYETEHRLRHKSGEWIWVLDRGRVLERDDDGEPLRVCGTHLDITERRRNELLLQRQTYQQAAVAEFGQYALSERSLDALFNRAVEIVAHVLDARFAEVLEHKPDEKRLAPLAGVGWDEKRVMGAPIPDGASSQSGYTLLQSTPVIVTNIHDESRFSPPSLAIEHRIVSGITVAIPGTAQAFGVLGAHHDQQQVYSDDDAHFMEAMANILAAAVQRAQTLEETGRAETKFRTVYDSSNDAILMLDEGGFFDCNVAAVRLFGLDDKTACIGVNPFDVSPPQQPCGTDSEAAARQHIAVATREGSDRFEWVHKRMDTGECFPVEVLLNRMELDGRTVFHSVVRDMSDRRKAELQLQQSLEELEESNKRAEAATRAKSEFLANMSHEIRTPMTAILGFTEVLQGEGSLDSAPPERIQALNTIQRNGEHLLRLINDILDLSKIEAGKLEVECTTCKPCQLLADVVSLMQNRAQAKNLTLETECIGALPERIQSDPMRLRQILINLIGNAIKFTETGGVRVTVGLLRDASRTPRLQFDVIDSGIGMTPAHIDKLFKPFAQADSSTTKQFGGSGLGLAISKRLAEMLNGDISVTSVIGKGSTFSVTVETGPLEDVPTIEKVVEAVAEPRSDQEPPATNTIRLDCRILLAEDGPDNQRLISFVLRKAGADVILAENGQTACEQALAAQKTGEPFDLILMDMQMPVLDGYDATRNLRNAGYRGPIVALTAHAMDGEEGKCRQAGCDGYLTKPIDRTDFLTTIADMTSRTFASHEVGAESSS